MKELYLMDYHNKKHETVINLDKLEDIQVIVISVISGDEVATILYKDGHTEYIDADLLSDGGRTQDDYDGTYVLYAEGLINRLEEFEKREDTYCLL